jgi:hypothetical protein
LFLNVVLMNVFAEEILLSLAKKSSLMFSLKKIEQTDKIFLFLNTLLKEFRRFPFLNIFIKENKLDFLEIDYQTGLRILGALFELTFAILSFPLSDLFEEAKILILFFSVSSDCLNCFVFFPNIFIKENFPNF